MYAESFSQRLNKWYLAHPGALKRGLCNARLTNDRFFFFLVTINSKAHFLLQSYMKALCIHLTLIVKLYCEIIDNY